MLKEPNINSVAWNTQYEDMLAFSGNETLALKVLDFPSHQQKLHGFVVGLSGSKVFCLNGSTMNTFDMALSAPMYQYIDRNMFMEAHKIACLGTYKECYNKNDGFNMLTKYSSSLAIFIFLFWNKMLDTLTFLKKVSISI